MTTFRRADGVSENPMDDDLFLVAPGSGEIVHLDQMAAAVWRLLETPCSQTEMIAVFVEAFPEMPADTVSADLQTALQTLIAAELVQECDGEPG
ncbi:MAG: PqqD family protein [Minwuia sp.]|nr:PqqD family protein [Minwuia sp.]